MTINFYLNNDKRSNNIEKAIFAYVRGLSRGKTIVLFTGERINPKYWDIQKQVAKKSYTGSPELNSYLNSFKEEIKKSVRILLTENPNAVYDEIKSALIKRFKQEEDSNNFLEVYKLFLEVRKTELSPGTTKKYTALMNLLQSFETETGYKLTFKSIDMMFFDRFSNYLFNVKKQTNNTVSKYFDNIKTFMTWATERKVNTNLDYMKFDTKEVETDVVYLTETELFRIYNLDLKDNPALEHARDVFCFCCFTGQRFSDVFKLERSDIKGHTWFLRTKKTKDPIKVPLNRYALELLNKYSADEKPLPVISEQKTNEHLKEIGKKAEITETIKNIKYRGSERIEVTFAKHDLITTHTGRRTFVTLSLEKGMRPETVMEITGHKDYKTFKKYIKITSTVKSEEMNKFWNNEPVLKVVKAG